MGLPERKFRYHGEKNTALFAVGANLVFRSLQQILEDLLVALDALLVVCALNAVAHNFCGF